MPMIEPRVPCLHALGPLGTHAILMAMLVLDYAREAFAMNEFVRLVGPQADPRNRKAAGAPRAASAAGGAATALRASRRRPRSAKLMLSATLQGAG